MAHRWGAWSRLRLVAAHSTQYLRAMQWTRLRGWFLAAGLVIRVLLLAFGEWQDATSACVRGCGLVVACSTAPHPLPWIVLMHIHSGYQVHRC